MLKLKVGVLGLLFFLSLLVGSLAPTFTTSSANAHVEMRRPAPFTIRGDRLSSDRVGRSCIHTVRFDLSRYRHVRPVRVDGPRGTHPTLRGAVTRNNWIIITYDRSDHRGRCEPDRRYHARQFTLHLVR